MKLVSYRQGGAARFGAVKDNGVVDLTGKLGADTPDIAAAFANGKMGAIADIVAKASPNAGLDEIEYDLPIPAPQKIMCIGRNYRAYHEVLEDGRPDWPSVFPRFVNSFAAHDQPIQRPKVHGDQLDYEGEIVVVIGKRCRHVKEADAMSVIGGYTVANEGSVRNWIGRGTQNCPVKNQFRSGSMGPWIVTADEIADPMKLHINTRVSGQTRQDGGADMMIFDIPYLISFVSTMTWLEPGDVICTGSPGGSAIEQDPPGYLKPGEVLEVEIPGIGLLRNPIEDEK
jgi:2-keto-4-pentenoate hydratase/2-oxohepta-3-ene-1,7-dioic acid hydratase in catechol pathway